MTEPMATPTTGEKPVLITAVAVTLPIVAIAWASDLPVLLGIAPYTEQFLALIIAISLAVVFLTYPAWYEKSRTRRIWDGLAAAISFGSLAYVAVVYERLLFDAALRTLEGVSLGALIIVFVMEALRRVAGLALFLIVLAFIAYAPLGYLLPGDFEGRPVLLERLAVYLALDTNALLGRPVEIGATVVLVFIFFGQLLFGAGGGRFFTDVAMATMGRSRGGPAKVAVVGSGLFGSISGSAVANVASTGVVTIPLMVGAGYRPVIAGAVEAVASTGGQIMPPVMGAAAFLMAEFLEIPYSEVVIAATIPAILYYLALYFQIDLLAARDNIRMAPGDMPRTRAVILDGWHFIVPFGILLYALFALNASPEAAALYASAGVIVGGVARSYGGERLNLSRIVGCLASTGFAVVEVVMILAAASFVIGVIALTGLGFALTQFLIKLAGADLFSLLLIAALICIVLGMGMPTAGVYVLLATLVAPAIVSAGTTEIGAHMFILYFGVMSMVTPPIALAAFAAATIAGTRPMATGWHAMRLSWVAFLIPFMFVVAPPLLMQGSVGEILVVSMTACLGVYCVSAGLVGYFVRHLGAGKRMALCIAGLALILPDRFVGLSGEADTLGAVVGGLMLIYELVAARRARRDSDARALG